MTLNERSKRSYCYRIPLDDRAAMLRIRRFERKEGYWIHKMKDRNVPNVNAKKNWGYVFYRSKETRGDQPGEFEGGVIPGLSEYRHSLAWKPMPHTELLEMRRSSGGGTEIRGKQFLGTHDPRIPDYMHIETTVPWTPGEVRDIFDGEPVPDKKNYHHEPPEIPADEARSQFRRLIEMAVDDAFEEAKQALYEYEENCEHQHVIKDESEICGDSWYCEDCGRDWEDEREMNAEEVNVVGTTA